jgi:hypothetical protein
MFFDVYILELLRLETITFSDATLSDINVVLCYVLSQYPPREYTIPLSKQLTCKGTLRQVFYLSEAPSSPMTLYSHPYTLCIRVYSILIHTGRGWGELTREKVRGAMVHKAGKNTNMTDCIFSL